mmetsp:Transcript_27943/g.59014  ORF Transcript_27943/g.59014 Transcript_27943/m.59014 type:complete len:294 (+) Transcript_27943:32-913(+)
MTNETSSVQEPLLEQQEEEEGQQEGQEQEQKRLYPDPFYCPLTKKVMADPVVAADGNSYEKSAVLERDAAADASSYYSNRALKTIIEKEKQRLEEQGFVGALHRAEESLRSMYQQILEKSAFPTGEYRPLPDAYYCPITLDLILRSAIDPEGNTYERQAIRGWIAANGTSPLTRNALRVDQLRENHALEDLIDAELKKTEGSMHPSIRRWKESRTDEPEGDEEEGGGSNPYPTTQQEIDERSVGRKHCICTLVAILFVFVVIGASLIFVPFEIVYLTFGCLVCCSMNRPQERN